VLLDREHGKHSPRRPPLSVAQILSWADAHRERAGCWPSAASGAVAGVPGENWRHVDYALRYARCSLPGGDSLARLLRRCRGDSAGHPWTAAEDDLVRTLPPPGQPRGRDGP
jgi:hypothetical protein